MKTIDEKVMIDTIYWVILLCRRKLNQWVLLVIMKSDTSRKKLIGPIHVQI